MSKEKKLYPREKYLSAIRPFYQDTEMIKVFTGVRRCGKSSLLLLIQKELKEKGVADTNILYVNLDKRPYIGIKTSDALERIIDEGFADADGVKYLFIDEVQNVKDFETSLNAYREDGDYSIFITGSNSYLLSGELVTKLTGRYLEVKMSTLTFDEYIDMKRFLGKAVNPSITEELRSYILEGGFPYALNYDGLSEKRFYVQSVVDEIFNKDVKGNKKIRKKRLFDLVMQFVVNNFGCTISVDNIVNHLKEVMHENVSKETVYNYITQLENLRIISKCDRFDLKSKKSLKGGEKYYLSDLSFYFLRNTDNRIPYGPVLENIVYQYARSIGYEVSVGKVGKLEVDFIMRNPSLDYSYVQVAMYILTDTSTEEREYRALEAIKDNYPKYLLTLDSLIQKRNGIIHANLAEFIRDGKTF